MNRDHHCVHQHIAELLKILVGEMRVNVLKQGREDLNKRSQERLARNVDLVRRLVTVCEGDFCAFNPNI